LLSDETFEKFDCLLFTEQGQISKYLSESGMFVGDIMKYVSSNDKLVFSSKKQSQNFAQVVKETFSRAGVNSNSQKIGFKSDINEVLITPVLTLRMLDQEVARKDLASEVLKKRAMTDVMGNITSKADLMAMANQKLSTNQTNELPSQLEDVDNSNKKLESVSERLASLTNIIALRKKILDKNNNLCATEKYIRDKKRILKEKSNQEKKLSFFFSTEY
jgi:hypothetical protein